MYGHASCNMIVVDLGVSESQSCGKRPQKSGTFYGPPQRQAEGSASGIGADQSQKKEKGEARQHGEIACYPS